MNSCFLHVAQPPIFTNADFFKPFGTFLICFDNGTGCICVDDPEAVMELLTGAKTDPVGWRDYGEILNSLEQPRWVDDDSRLMIDDDVIVRMEKRAANKKLRLYDPLKKLNDMKISMMHIERYIKKSKIYKIGYYDRFKTYFLVQENRSVDNARRALHDYWRSTVEEIETSPALERRRILHDGSIYSRVIEPLDIAAYYRHGNSQYRTWGRSHHYVMLEKWCKEEVIKVATSEWTELSDVLMSDPCFWAEVEEAMIVIKQMKAHKRMTYEVLAQKIVLFKEYVWKMIREGEVSPDIFLENSTFMRWWKEYKMIKGRYRFKFPASDFTEYMDTGMYKSYGLMEDRISGSVVRPKKESSKEDLYECRAKDVIDFPRMQQAPDNREALVGRPSLTCKALDTKMKENPFPSAAVTSYLKEMRRETEGILVFSCNDNDDVDESLFIEAILSKLHEREVTPLEFNLSGRESLDSEMLYRSCVGIMVLSNSSTRKSQSLDHLVNIMVHWKAKDLVVIPVYYKVKLSDIVLECQSEPANLQNAQPDRVQKWKAAFAEMASINGHQYTEGNQVMLAEEVVRNAWLYLRNSKNVVNILALLNQSQPSDAEIVGIWGMAGIGKTSIAKEIFEILSPQYDLCYFHDFYLMAESKGLRKMRDDFYSKVFGEERLSIDTCDIKPSFMRGFFHRKKILVVLDDVSNARDAETVVGGFGWFSYGHRVILTSRRKQVLVRCKVKAPYEIQRLCVFESFRLCQQYINGEGVAISEVISELMSCSSGIPLALKLLGSSVSTQHPDNMMKHLQTLRRNPLPQMQENFRRSFDRLDENEKNIFLDLACFFRGEKKDHVVKVLDASGFFTYLGICNLINESLISLVDNRIEMPIPFQDIGRFIVLEEDTDPCNRSRLWDSGDIADVLTNNSGTEATEGIFLDASDLTCELSPTVFSEMYSLRLLKFYCSTISGKQCKLSLPQGLDTFPDELRLLHWEHYPLEYLPQKFNPENLVEINMPYSNMEKLWEGKKNLEKLKKIKLSHSRKLTDILMLSEALNLEHIDLEGCTSLIDVSTSIPPHLGKLVSLNMKDCSHLQSLPSMVDLTSLKIVNLSGCSKLEDIKDIAPNLEELYLAGTAITELPLSIENLTELVMLDLENCKMLQQLPMGIRHLKSIVELKLSGCTSL